MPVIPALPRVIAHAILSRWLVFRQRLLDPRLMARARLFAIQHDGMLELDAERRVVDFNESAQRLLAAHNKQLLGQPLESVSTALSSALRAHELRKDGLDAGGGMLLNQPEGGPAFDVHIITLKSEEGLDAGWLLSLRGVDGNRRALKLEELGLSPRERQLIEWVGRGLSNKEIATVLSIETSTVKNHLYNVFRKCGVSSRMELLHVARGVPEPHPT
jgi:DNA-binding CsgD family transcriptional regulator